MLHCRAPSSYRADQVQERPQSGCTAPRSCFTTTASFSIVRGVLVVGPNQRFLRYIGQVLPSLGEHAVTQLTVEGVASTRRFAKGVDSDDVATVKGLSGDDHRDEQPCRRSHSPNSNRGPTRPSRDSVELSGGSLSD